MRGSAGSITFRNFKAPWKRYSYRKTGFAGSIVLTEQRLVAYAFSQKVINLPLTHPHFSKLMVTLERDDCLCVAFEASDFQNDSSGSIELRFHTPHARVFADRLTPQGA